MRQTKGLLGVVVLLSLLVVSPARSQTAVTTKTGGDQDVQVLLKKYKLLHSDLTTPVPSSINRPMK